MRIIVVCSGTRGYISPFIKEQVDSLTKNHPIKFSYFKIKRNGVYGYLSHLPELIRSINKFKPDLIHAHYGYSGLLANMQFRVPVVTTFHGSDVNKRQNIFWSSLAHKLSSASIFVEKRMMSKFKKHKNSFVIPCGVDLELFSPLQKHIARDILHLNQGDIYILLYSGRPKNKKINNCAAFSCENLETITKKKVHLIEMSGFSREEVSLYLNSAECALYLSFNAASPQFIKEAMSCNRPIVTTNVGDVKQRIQNTEGCFITSIEPTDLTNKLLLAINYENLFLTTNGREKITNSKLDVIDISNRVYEVYKSVL